MALEWPKMCLYWQWGPVQTLINELGLKLYEVHGCAFGCTDPKGNRVFKPWIIATNDPSRGGRWKSTSARGTTSTRVRCPSPPRTTTSRWRGPSTGRGVPAS